VKGLSPKLRAVRERFAPQFSFKRSLPADSLLLGVLEDLADAGEEPLAAAADEGPHLLDLDRAIAKSK
jgi:hypothetical protein